MFKQARFLATALRRSWLVISIVMGLLLLPPGAGAAEDPVARVVELTNIERERAGLPPLAYNWNLTRSARAYVGVLASGDCWAHTCGPRPYLPDRADAADYSNWVYLGENLGGGQYTPEAVVADWMRSPTHRANILDPGFREIGVAVAIGGRYGIYWVQEFGTRSRS